MSKCRLFVAVLAGLVATSPPSRAVELNPDGMGQVLVYPYYTVNAGLSTLLSVVNDGSRAKLVKVRFLEAYNGQRVLDFNLFLSAYDVWTAAVFALDANGGANVLTEDRSCTNPSLVDRSNKLPDGRSYEPFRNNEYQGAGPRGLERTREGHIEIIEMATIAAGSDLEAAVSHVDGVPRDCARARATQGNDPALLSPGGGLYGSGTIVNPAVGTLYAYSADAIDGFHTLTDGPVFQDNLPRLNAAATSPTTARAFNYATVAGEGANLVTVSDYALANAIDAVSAVFTASSISNEYILEATAGAETDWVLTFPTKNYYVNAGEPIPPFTKTFTTADASCVKVSYRTLDREERRRLGSVPLPAPTELPLSLCYETQVISFSKAADYAAAGGLSQVLGSRLTANIDPRAVGFTSGQLVLNLDGVESHALRPSLDGDVFHGLPVTGFMAVNYINGNNNGALANYSGTYRHRAQRRCTSAAEGQAACS